MIDDLLVVNLRPDVPTALGSLQWQTCLRRIAFLHRDELTLLPEQPDFQVYCGRKAYHFLLEVICGLHSPLLGENAVMGQFRKFRASAQFPNTLWGRFLRKLTTDLLVDARLVRHLHLQGLGSQSYGSLIRRRLKGPSSVAVLGAGSLAREILPWLTDVRVFYRNSHHASDLQDKHPHVQVEQFIMADAGWHGNNFSLVIAAPLDAAEINKWLALQNIKFLMILDLRGNAEADPIRSQAVISLSELLTSLHDDQKRIEHHLNAAQKEIESLTSQRFLERHSKQAGWKPQIQTHSSTRVSASLLCTKSRPACEAGVEHKAWGVSPRCSAVRILARETGNSSRCCGFRPLSRAQTCIAYVPGANAPGFLLDACFAGSATFCGGSNKVQGYVRWQVLNHDRGLSLDATLTLMSRFVESQRGKGVP